MSIVTEFWQQTLRRGNSAAFLATKGGHCVPYSWAQLAAAVAHVADRLKKLGIANGDVVASRMPNSLSWIAFDLACQSLGICHAAIDHREPVATARLLTHEVCARALVQSDENDRQEINLQIEFMSGATTAITASKFEPLTAEHARDWERQACGQFATASPVQILFTSGSTGQRKAVQLSEENLLSNALAKLDAAPQYACDMRLNILPFSHAYARTCELSTWLLTGGQLAIAKDWAEFVELAPLLRPTLVNCVPLLAQRIAGILEQRPSALGGSFRLLQVGGAALPAAVFERLARLGLPPICGYGMTETSPVVCSGRTGLQTTGTVGFPVQGVEIRVDTRSQLHVRGSGVMLGYLNAKAPCPIDADGWFATGDLASIRGDGQVVILGRQSAQIVLSTGYKVDPTLVESRLMLSGLIRHCLVTGDGQSSLSAMVSFVDHNSQQRDELFEKKVEQLACCLPELFADLPRHAVPKVLEPFPIDVVGNPRLLTAKGTLRRSLVLRAIEEFTS